MKNGDQNGEGGTAVLDLEGLEEGRTRIAIDVTAAEVDLEDPHFQFPTPFHVELEIYRSLQSFSIKGEVAFTIAGQCCRCLKPAREENSAPLSLLIQRRQASDEELEALSDQDDVIIIYPGARDMDLTQRIREAVALELPMSACCRDDCRGLCSQCGQDLNEGSCNCAQEKVDPRWEALVELKIPQ